MLQYHAACKVEFQPFNNRYVYQLLIKYKILPVLRSIYRSLKPNPKITRSSLFRLPESEKKKKNLPTQPNPKQPFRLIRPDKFGASGCLGVVCVWYWKNADYPQSCARIFVLYRYHTVAAR